MQDTNVNVKLLKGLYEGFPQPTDSVFELINWEVNKYTGGWTNQIGYENYKSNATNYNPFTLNRVDSLFYVQRHQGAQDSILFESGGALYQLNEWDGLQKNVLSQSRTRPLSSEVCTQYAQFGRYVIYVNGYDRPSKSMLWPVTDYSTNYLVELPLGFDNLPPAPIAWGVETDPTKIAASGDVACIWQSIISNIGDRGLGIPINAKENSYRYRVSFVNTAGAEGPLSSISNIVEWETPVGKLRFVIPVEIPLGNEDIIARRVYRTKNFSDDGGADGNTYYFVAEIPNNKDDFFTDDIPDTALGSVAPADSESIPFPAQTCRYLGVYKDCLFVDGGRDNDLALYFSHPAKPDQFGALNFITLSHRQGGGLTGMASYFNNLLLFREYSIDIVRGNYPNFTSSNLTSHVGTVATNTVTSVVGLGIVFLSYDGIYSININLDYNDNPTVKNITPHLRDTFARINKDAMATATAVYSKKRKEFIVHFPVDGSPINNLGLVLHVDKGSWSVRENIPVGKMIVNAGGDVIFGIANDATATQERGLMVLSKKRAAGTQLVADNMTDNPALTSTIRSAWLDFGDASLKKKIHSVYLFVATGGNQDIAMDYYMDFNYNSQDSTVGLRQQRPDFADQEVYDLVTLDGGAFWEEPLVTTIRYDVYSQACSHFQWKISTTADMHIIGYAVDYTSAGMRVIKGKKL